MKRGYLFIALATLFFSTMEIALKEVAGLFNPVQLNLTRFLIGGLVLIPFARRMLRKRGVRIDGLSLVKLAGLGFLGIVVSMTLYQLAVENTNASVVAVLFSCNPVFVLVFAGLILRTQILRQHVMALVLECLGILILINPLDHVYPAVHGGVRPVCRARDQNVRQVFRRGRDMRELPVRQP